MSDEWNVRIFVPAEPGVPFSGMHGYRDRGVPQAKASDARGRADRVVDASVESLRENWRETVAKLVEIGNGVDDGASEWGVSQIEVGLTLSATGQLLFIAQAGAEASVKITLTRRPTGEA